MRAIKEWEDRGYIGISLGLEVHEIDQLIAKLHALKADPAQHFHLTSTYKDETGVGDIEIYVQTDEASNMTPSSFAFAAHGKPDAQPFPRADVRVLTRPPLR